MLGRRAKSSTQARDPPTPRFREQARSSLRYLADSKLRLCILTGTVVLLIAFFWSTVSTGAKKSNQTVVLKDGGIQVEEKVPNDLPSVTEAEPVSPVDSLPISPASPRIIMIPFLAQTNAATYRSMEFLKLMKEIHGVGNRKVLEPFIWVAPFNDTGFEEALKTLGKEEAEALVRHPKHRYRFIVGEEFHGLSRYFDLDPLKAWTGLEIERVEDVPNGIIEVDRLLILCGNKTEKRAFKPYRKPFKLHDKLYLKFKDMVCYDKQLQETCTLPSVKDARTIAIVPGFGHPAYECASGSPTATHLLANLDLFWSVRPHFRWAARLREKAEAFKKEKLNGRFISIHWRRGDKMIEEKFRAITPTRLASWISDIKKKYTSGGKPFTAVFLATNSGNPKDIEELQALAGLPVVLHPQTPDWRANIDDSIIEQILCTDSDYFIAAPSCWLFTSGFSRMVMDQREMRGVKDMSMYQYGPEPDARCNLASFKKMMASGGYNYKKKGKKPSS
mmetsp:Transcript_45590/g.74301  ORF Transcript_45590/g.74301 Transcript_45590/m.74301 type:complete len:503 (-) Transcript_45590:326-1834(-)